MGNTASFQINKDPFVYELDPSTSTAKIIKYLGDNESIIISKSIQYKNREYTIISIGTCSFVNNKQIKTVEFSQDSELFSIDASAFYGSSIERIILPPSLTKIDNNVFGNCKNLQTIDIPPNVRIIESNTFMHAHSLKNVTFGEDSKLEKIGFGSFERTSIESIKIPKHVKIIDKGAFKYTKRLRELKFADDSELEIIGDYAFNNSKAKSVTIPSSVKIIGNNSFADNYQLEKVEFQPNSQIQEIGEQAFRDASIESISIPPHVKIIKSKTFYNCSKLKYVSFPEDSELTKIEKTAFSSNIESIFFPPKVEVIEEGWCIGVNSFNNFTISPENKNFKIIDNKFLVGKLDKESDNFDVIINTLRGEEEVSIPSYIKRIGKMSFLKGKLKTIVFPSDSKLELIGKESFYRSLIESITIPSNVEIIEEDSFTYCENLKEINFAEDSKLRVFKKSTFVTNIERIFIPSKVEIIEEGWFDSSLSLKDIKISTENKNFIYYEDRFLIGKTDPKSDNLDLLLFSRPDIEEALIPSFIRKIGQYAFNQRKIKNIKFTENSELQIIGESAFDGSFIKEIEIPSKIEKISFNAFNECNDLRLLEFKENCPMSEFKIDTLNGTSPNKITLSSNINKISSGFCQGFLVQYIEFLSDNVTFGKNFYIYTTAKVFSFPNSSKISFWKENIYYEEFKQDFILFAQAHTIIDFYE